MFHPSGDPQRTWRQEEGPLLLRSRAALWRRIASGRSAQQPLRTGSQESDFQRATVRLVSCMVSFEVQK